MEAPIKYAKSGDVHIAYRIFGDGPRDIVLVPGTISHLELLWEVPTNKYLIQRLTSFSRVIVFDKRGQGLSDRVGEQTLEERIGDVGAVMDAAGSRRAIVYGWSEGGPMSLMFAATHPERISALVLYGTFASIKAEPWAQNQAQFEKFCAALEKHWGEGVLLRFNAPSRSKDEALVQWFGRIERDSASPASILALMRGNYENDVRHLLSSIQVPTLILHRAGDAMVPVAAGRYLAEKIAGAVYHELPGKDHLVLDHETQDRIADLIEDFVARQPISAGSATRSGNQPDPHPRRGRPISRSWSRAAAGNSSLDETALILPRHCNLFRNEGEYWTLSYDGHAFRMRDSKGLRYLAHLLAHPHSEFHAAALAAGSPRTKSIVDSGTMGDTACVLSARHGSMDQVGSAVLGDAGEILDAQAKAAYRQRIKDLGEELEQAKRVGDEKRGVRLDEEIEMLSAELARAVGLHGRDRRAASGAERARVNVTRTIRIAIARINRHHSGLANYLDTTIRTGRFCSYQPDPARQASWSIIFPSRPSEDHG